MKLTALIQNVKKALMITERVLGKNVHLPILETFLLKTNINKVEVSSTNLEIGTVTTFPAKVEQKGIVAVPARPLLNFLQQINDLKVQLISEGKVLRLVTDSYSATLQTFDPDEFPLIPEVKEKQGLELESALFARAMEQVIIASSVSDLRPEFNSVFLYFEPKENFKLVATDTYRLAEKRIALSDLIAASEIKQSCLIPLKTAQEVMRIAKEQPESVSIFLDPNQILFSWKETRLVSRLLEGEFPEYGSVVPQEFCTTVILRQNKFLEALKVSGVFSSRLNDVRFTVRPSEKKFILHASDSMIGENQAIVPIEAIEGTDIEISFNYRYLLDVLAVLDSKNKIVLRFSDIDRPVLLQQEADDSYFYILMPLRV